MCADSRCNDLCFMVFCLLASLLLLQLNLQFLPLVFLFAAAAVVAATTAGAIVDVGGGFGHCR